MKKQGIWIVYTLFCVSQCFSTLSASETSEDRQRDTFTLYDRNRRELDWDRQHGGHRGFGQRPADTTNSPHNEQAWIYGSDRRDERSRPAQVYYPSRGYSPYERDYNWNQAQSWDGRNSYPSSHHRAASRPAMPPTE